MEGWPAAAMVGGAGFLIGLVFGATVQRTHFCAMGAISDIVLFDDWRRMRSWLLAIGIAVLGSQALDMAGVVDLGRSFYAAPGLSWLALLLGGLMFGFGMTLTGGCTSRNVVRLGAGSLKSLLVLLVLGVVAGMTMTGVLALARLQLQEGASVDLSAAAGSQTLADLLAAASNTGADAWQALLALALGGGLIVVCFKDARFRRAPREIAAGLILGALVPLGWVATGVLGASPSTPTPLTSLAFVEPVANGLLYVMTFLSTSLSFGVALVGGAILGAFLVARARREFRIEGFAGLDDLRRHLTGAALMGMGGVLAMGCTIGQGMSGLSTLALGSVIAFLSIIAGGVAGIRYLEQGSLINAVRALLAGG